MLLTIRKKILFLVLFCQTLATSIVDEQSNNNDSFIKASIQIFNFLLRLFPKHFRHKLGTEMTQVFRDSCKDTLNEFGLLGLSKLWIYTLFDLFKTALLEQADHKYEQLFVLYYQRQGKRLFDLVIAVPALILTFPSFCIISLLIRLESNGPILERDTRLGQFGKPFLMYKFRTTQSIIANGHEKSISTRVGYFLHLTSLNELPQIFNVLRGDMSMVGPLPVRANVEVNLPSQMQKLFDFQKNLPILPGLTGFWQLKRWQLDKPEDLHNAILEKFRLDSQYIENTSFWTDIIILLKNVLVTINHEIGKRDKTQK